MLQRQLDAVKKDKQVLQKELDNCQISGAIAASVRSGLMFYAEINLIAKMAKLDTGGVSASCRKAMRKHWVRKRTSTVSQLHH